MDEKKETYSGRGARRLLFTSWDESKPFYDEKHMRYLCYQREKCPDTKRLHWQCFVHFKQPQRYGVGQMANQLLHLVKSARFEAAHGSNNENKHYCSKPVDECECKHCAKARKGHCFSSTFEEFGVCDQQEQRKLGGLSRACDLILNEGYDVPAVAKEEPETFVRHHRGLVELDKHVNGIWNWKNCLC